MYIDYNLQNRVKKLEQLFKCVYCEIKKGNENTEVDPIFTASPAYNITTNDINFLDTKDYNNLNNLPNLNLKANLSGAIFTGNISAPNLSGTNTGDETTSTIQSKRPLKTVAGQSLEGTGNITISLGTQIKQFFDSFTGNVLTLTNTPKSNTIINVIENGVILREGVTRDYTISGNTVTLVSNRTNVDIEINYTY